MSDDLGERRRGVRPPDSLLLRRALRRHRREAGLFGTEAGGLLGVSASNLSRAETGARLPFSALRLSNAFGIPLDKVLDPCPRCGYDPEPGFKCLHCGASEEDLHHCPSCDHTAGTLIEINDHAKRAHPEKSHR